MEYLFKSNTQALGVSFSTIILVVIIKVIGCTGGQAEVSVCRKAPLCGFNIHVGSGYTFRCFFFFIKGPLRTMDRSSLCSCLGCCSNELLTVPYLGALYSSERVIPAQRSDKQRAVFEMAAEGVLFLIWYPSLHACIFIFKDFQFLFLRPTRAEHW